MLDIPKRDMGGDRLQNPDLSDVRCHAVGLDLQSRPIEYKDLQSATPIGRIEIAHFAIKD